jgi:hypothetical protein
VGCRKNTQKAMVAQAEQELERKRHQGQAPGNRGVWAELGKIMTVSEHTTMKKEGPSNPGSP